MVVGDQTDLGPLPEIPGRVTSEAAAMTDLERFLSGWQSRHNLTSAEYVAYVARALRYYGDRLLAIERREKPK